MFHPRFGVRLLIGIAVLVVPIFASMAAVDWRDVVNATVASRDAMIRVLGSVTPNLSLGDEAQTFDRLIGADFSYGLAILPEKKGAHDRNDVPLL